MNGHQYEQLPEFAAERLFDQRDEAIEQARRYRLAWLSARRRANRGWLNYHAAIGVLDAVGNVDLAATNLPGVACFDHREVGVVRDCMRCDTARLYPPRRASDSSHGIALEVLAQLSERSTDGRLRDAIAQARSALWDEVER